MIKTTLSELQQYFLATRQVGHTKLLKSGLSHNPRTSCVLVASKKDEDLYKDILHSENIVSISDLRGLRGRRQALAIDNHALLVLFNQCLDHIRDLEVKMSQQMTDFEENYRSLNNSLCTEIYRLNVVINGLKGVQDKEDAQDSGHQLELFNLSEYYT